MDLSFLPSLHYFHIWARLSRLCFLVWFIYYSFLRSSKILVLLKDEPPVVISSRLLFFERGRERLSPREFMMGEHRHCLSWGYSFLLSRTFEISRHFLYAWYIFEYRGQFGIFFFPHFSFFLLLSSFLSILFSLLLKRNIHRCRLSRRAFMRGDASSFLSHTRDIYFCLPFQMPPLLHIFCLCHACRLKRESSWDIFIYE